MIYVDKNSTSSFSLPLLDMTSFALHGYLLKLTNALDSEQIEYLIPTIVSENERFTTLESIIYFKAGQYRYNIYEFDSTQPDPTDETGLNSIATGVFIIVETETNNIYI